MLVMGLEMRWIFVRFFVGGGREDVVEVWEGLLDGWTGRWGGGGMEGQEGG